mmetsp:Transcript_65795/g.157226  ORF Transcript_65795/g.157226 Transcript_65795/m.157226 type:complete len:266 (+) Transcript_65795:1228-2025(+)
MHIMAKKEEHCNNKAQHTNGEHQDSVATHHREDALGPWVISIHTAGDGVDPADTSELRSRWLRHLPEAICAPLDSICCRSAAPKVHEEDLPDAHEENNKEERVVVGSAVDPRPHLQPEAHNGRQHKPLVEVSHEKEVHRNLLTKVVSDLMDASAPCECVKPMVVQYGELVVLMQWEVVEHIAVMHELANVDASTVETTIPDDIVNDLNSIHCTEDGIWSRILRTLLFLLILQQLVMKLKEVRNYPAVTVSNFPCSNIVVLELCEG